MSRASLLTIDLQHCTFKRKGLKETDCYLNQRSVFKAQYYLGGFIRKDTEKNPSGFIFVNM